MTIENLKYRYRKAAVDVILELKAIKFPELEYDIKRQLVRSSSSTAANYRSACRAKSNADFINKLKTVEEECDESIFWLEFLKELGVNLKSHNQHLKEYDELLAITVSSIKTARKNS